MSWSFIVVGDPHIPEVSGEEQDRLKRVVKFINSSDVDFCVFMGDLVSNSTPDKALTVSRWNAFKSIVSGLKKTTYYVIGNHDVQFDNNCIKNRPIGWSEYTEQECNFHKILGIYPDQLYTIKKGNKKYQLIMIAEAEYGGSGDASYFKFDLADKSKPTFVFTHDPVPIYFNETWGTMMPELLKFTNLMGVYMAHRHYGQVVQYNNNQRTKYILAPGSLASNGTYKWSYTDYVGYTKVYDNDTTDYTMLNYNLPFVNPFQTQTSSMFGSVFGSIILIGLGMILSKYFNMRL